MIETVIILTFVCSGFVHTTAGFGSALVAMPIMTLLISVQTAAPVQALVGLSLAAYLLYVHRQSWQWREALPILCTSIPAVPIGTVALKHLPKQYMLGCLSAVLLGYVLYVFIQSRVHRDKPVIVTPPSMRTAIGGAVTGLFAGLLGGAYATNGPPLVIYGAIRQWDKKTFRSIVQSCFLLNGIFIVFWHTMSGLLTREVGWYSLFALPGLMAGMWLGFRVDPHINHERFRKLVLTLMFILGLALAWRAITA